jgi:hypothetical protein
MIKCFTILLPFYHRKIIITDSAYSWKQNYTKGRIGRCNLSDGTDERENYEKNEFNSKTD